MKLTEHISHIRIKYHKLGQNSSGTGGGFNPKKFNNDEMLRMQSDYIQSLQSSTSLLQLYNDQLDILSDKQVLLSDGIGRVTRVQELYYDSVQDVINQITYLEQQNASLNKSFGITSERAAELGKEFRDIATDTKRSQATIFEYADSLKSLTGGYIASSKMETGYRKNLIATRAVLQGNLGLTEAQAEGFEKYAAALKLSSSELLLSMTEGQGSLVSQLSSKTGLEQTAVLKTLIEEISSLSSDVRLNFSKIPGNLELAVLKTKALGISMSQLQATGKGLLNIEQAIAKEFEYQQLTGKRILDDQGNSITNQYKTAYLMKNGVKQADLLRQAVAGQADELERSPMNVTAFAETFMIAEDKVADMLTQLQLAKQMGAEAIFKITDPTQLAGEMAKAQQAYIEKAGTDPERKKAADAFEELSKKFFASKNKDTRTTHEAAVEDNLSIMAAGINKMAGDPANQAALVKRAREASDALNKKSQDIAGKFTETGLTSKQPGSSAYILANQQMLKNANYASGVTKTIYENTMVNDLTSKVDPLKKINDMIDKVNKGIQVHGVSQTNLDRASIAVGSANINVGSTTSNAIDTNDALIMPSRGPILRPAKNDVIAAFRPNDVIDRTLNQTSMPTTTTTPAIDINALASAIATAVSKIKVEATIKQDTFLGTTNMNNPRLFT